MSPIESRRLLEALERIADALEIIAQVAANKR